MQGLLIAGRYRLADSIGSGGMGRVWRAHDEVLHRTVAVKELTAALYVSDSDRAVLLARTRAEARAAARINHSAVVTVHDVLEHDGRPWIVMELVEGNSLADAVKERGRVEPTEAARIGLWVLRALRAAHSAGVLHRDVKPGNVLLGRDGRVLLTDFGIAQIEGDSTITRTGEVVGSVDYLAPERVRGHDPGPASDLWALGATLYTAVEGRSPFRRTSPLGTMQAVVEEEADEPRHAGALGPVISALLRKEPERRPSAEEAEQMLAEAVEGRRPHTAQAFIPTQGSGLHTGGPSTSGHSPTGPTSGYGPASGTGSTGTVHGPGAPAGPGRSMTGPTAVAPTPSDAGRARPRPRRRLRTLALVVAVAAVLGGGAAVAYQQWGGTQQNTASGGGAGPATTSPSGSSSAASAPGGTAFASWKAYHDPWGFTVYLPKGWQRKVVGVPGVPGGLKQVDYTPDGGYHFVRIAMDPSPDFQDAYQHQLDLEQQLQGLVDYKRVALKANNYRDRNGSVWEYTWYALKKDPPHVAGPRHAIEETYFARSGTEYAIYMSTPEQDWVKTSKQFKWVLQSWQEPNEG
ncbi:serine/threonine protein kinase [Streptomyces puniciscabiei]|uniref:non-specific serine/threonine protein kinase n=1 Tax=Streptomyces puniciscabiei TaxID=164348 RepID=A0A542UDC1_9ACTN|nr:serine/threonine-protein kinase [Streptomyces puniciscabiei]TQK97065.1 serine/threonine protein kinase [Streptomyces puniciscabiei]